jgi:8-oxo-dGTP pyrophosphatase MutT (NUDIX family)
MEQEMSKEYFKGVASIEESRAGLVPYSVTNDKYFVAMMKPTDPKYGGSDFQLCKGRIDGNDTPEETAVKECKQELGLEIQQSNIKLLWNNKDRRMIWYFCKVDGLPDMIPGPNEDGIIETKDAKWFEINEAQKIIRGWQRPILLMLKRRLGI